MMIMEFCGSIFYIRLAQSFCVFYFGVAPIPYVSDTILNPSNPYSRPTCTAALLAEITVSNVELVYLVHVNLHIEFGTPLQQVILYIYPSSMQSKEG